MKETEGRLDEWCEGGLGQQRNDGGGNASMRERSERVEPWYMCNYEFHVAIFAWPCVLSDHLNRSGRYHLERGGMPLHDVVGINCKKGATTEYQGIDVKYMGEGVYVDDCVCVCYLT